MEPQYRLFMNCSSGHHFLTWLFFSLPPFCPPSEAVCEGNFTCKENEVCVRPNECRCRHGYFGAKCETSESSKHLGAPCLSSLGTYLYPGGVGGRSEENIYFILFFPKHTGKNGGGGIIFSRLVSEPSHL